jgi:hypothetical protein
MIVPLEVLSTLDILKKLPPPFLDLARQATLYLADQFERNASKSGKRSSEIRLKSQAEGSAVPWVQVEEKYQGSAKSEEKVETRNSLEVDVEIEESIETGSDTPRFLRPLLQCYFFHRQSDPSTTFVLASPSPNIEKAIESLPPASISPQPVARAAPGHKPTAPRKMYSAADRSSGAVAKSWAHRFGVEMQIVTPKETSDALERFKEWQRKQNEAKRRDDGRMQVPQSQRKLFVP